MLELNSKDIRFLARMGARGTLGQAVYDYIKDGNELYVVSADLAHASGFDRIQNEYPDRLINVGIAEQNLLGVASGLARTGIPVIATSWAMFSTVRVADQVRNYMGFMQSNVKLVGMDSGFMQSRFSYSHTNPPDIAIMRSIPGIKILSPCDGTEIYKCIYEALKYNGPVYIRLTGDALMPIVHKEADYTFEIGKSLELKSGSDVAIIATGNVTKNALDAAMILEEKQINARVIDMHTIEPLDTVVLDNLLTYNMVVSVEEHLLHGGMGSAIAEYYSSKKTRPQHIMLGVNDRYTSTGDPKYIEQENGLSAQQIADRIGQEIKGVDKF